MTPAITRATTTLRLSPGVDHFASYLDIIIGKGSGSGWDSGESRVAAKILTGTASPVVVDAGANMGDWTRSVRKRLGHGDGRWILIEPVAELAEALHSIPNVEVINCAIGERDEIMPLYVPNRPSGWMSLHQRNDSFAKGEEFSQRDVPVRRLDEILPELGIDRVDCLKMDLEGHELFALRGLAGYLAAHKVKALCFEFGSGNVNSRTFFRDFWELLTPLGFRLYRIAPGGRVIAIPDYEERLESFRGVSNYVAVLDRP